MPPLFPNPNSINAPGNPPPPNQGAPGNPPPPNQGGQLTNSALPPQNPTPPAPPANSINTTTGNDNITGDSLDNFILGSSGTDSILGGLGTDTISYLSLSNGITLEAKGIVDKGAAGTDSLQSIEQIIAPLGQINTIDASTGSGTASINANLSQNSLAVNNLPGIGTLNFTVENFANVTGTPNVDVITGNNLDNYLIGGAGNDTLSGGRGNDTLIGVNPSSATPGSNETDLLIGGRGRDVFVLGDAAISYYQGTGVALIQDFQQGIDRIQLHGSISNYNIVGNSINLAGTSDQIAVIQGAFTPDSFIFV
ncbi:MULTISPECIES: calcium-binding protein [unclassified Microcoleus]|uniref:calcium-binding protein n=1 Tax=unclassified Microcoleus TaxID=2642155 RepID=UPI002FD0B734